MARSQQLVDDGTVTLGAGELVDRLAIPFETQPSKAVEDGGDGGRRRAFAIGVLDAQQHAAAEMTGIEPVEQCSPRATDMEEAGRRGGEAGDDLFGHETILVRRSTSSGLSRAARFVV